MVTLIVNCSNCEWDAVDNQAQLRNVFLGISPSADLGDGIVGIFRSSVRSLNVIWSN